MSKSKVYLILIIIFSVIGCILIGGYITLKTFTSEKAIKTRFTERLEALTGGKFTIEQAHFDPFKGLKLSNFKFEGKNPKNLRIEGESILIRHEPLALLRGKILINSIMIVSPELFLVREKDAIWRFLNGVKAMLDHSGISYPTDQLGRGVVVKAANVHVYDDVIFREGVLNIENVDFFGQQLGGSLRDIHIKGIINDGLWKGLELDVDTNLATPELKLVAQTRDKTMTEEIMKELPVIGEKFWKTYLPTGKFNFDCTLDYNNKDDKRKMDYLLELDVVDGETTYVKWPFLVKRVNGKLEYSRDGVYLKSMKGDVQNEGQQIHGEIDAFFSVSDSRKSINLSVPGFNVTEKFMKMIPDVGEKVWNDYHPKGNIDLTIKYESNEDKSVTDFLAKASCKGIEAKNPFVPYDVSNIIGLVEADGKNVYLKNMSGYLLNESKVNHSMIDGVINLKTKEKRFIVSIPNLDMTEKLIKSVPNNGEGIWAKYKPAGQVDFMLNYRGFEDSSRNEYVITVDGKGDEVEYADLSIELTDIIGRVVVSKNDVQLKNLRGYLINGDQLARIVCNGSYKLKSKDIKTLYNVFDLAVTDEYLDKFPKLLRKDWFKIEPMGRVNVTLDDEVNNADGKDRHSVIVDTKGCKFLLTIIPVTVSDIDGRLNVEGGQLTIRNLNGTYCGGRINGSVEANITSPNGEYSGKFNYDKLSLKKLMKSFVKEMKTTSKEKQQKVKKTSRKTTSKRATTKVAPQELSVEQEWTGVCEGNIELQGEGNDIKNFTAEGSVKLREGQLAEVPVLLSILKLLNLSLPKKESFHTANLKYSVRDKIVNIEELEVFSDSVELGCVGTVGFDSTVDLTVIAGLSQETFSQIPFLGGLMDFVVGGVRKKLTKVQITGTLSKPKSKMVGLKPFTDPIKRIFDVLSPAEKNKKEDGEKKNIKTNGGKKAKNRVR